MQYTMRSIFLRLASSALCLILLLNLNIVRAQSVDTELSVGMLSSKTTTINPLLPKERDILNVYNLVYESLIKVDDNGLPVPYLAKDFEFTGDSIRFTMRENLVFSDGTPLTAYDVEACGNFILQRANDEYAEDKGYYSPMAANIKSFKANSESELLVSLKRSYFMSIYSLDFPIVPKAVVGYDNPIGSGAYVISSFDPARNIFLDQNSNWWQAKPQVKNISIRLYQNNKDMISDYEYGRLDSAITRSLAGAQYKSGINSLSIPYSTKQIEVLLMNNNEFRLKDKESRLAILKGIDINDIISRLFSNRVTRCQTPIAPNSWLFTDIENDYAYNFDAAAKMLEDLGWADNDDDNILDKIDDNDKKANFALRLLVYEDAENNIRYEMATRIKSMLEKLKISVKIISKSLAETLEILKAGNFDLALVAFNVDNAFDPGFMLYSNNVKVGNFSRYKSKQMDDLLNDYRKKTDPSELRYVAGEIQRQFLEDLPFIPLFYRTGSLLTRKVFTNVRDIREKDIFRGIESFTSGN